MTMTIGVVKTMTRRKILSFASEYSSNFACVVQYLRWMYLGIVDIMAAVKRKGEKKACNGECVTCKFRRLAEFIHLVIHFIFTFVNLYCIGYSDNLVFYLCRVKFEMQ